MTKKDYIKIANLIKDLPPRIDKVELVNRFIKVAIKDNPRFDTGRFIAGCLGLTFKKLDFKDIDAKIAESSKGLTTRG